MRSNDLTSFRVGSDGRESWHVQAGRDPKSAQESKHVFFRPYEDTHKRGVSICDPFGAKRFPSVEKAIEALRLEYLGEVKREGRNCHRIRSWAGSVHSNNIAIGLWDFVIDAQSLLPAICDTYTGGGAYRYEFVYERVNEPIPQEKFQAPAGAGVTREPFQVEEGAGYLVWRVSDGGGGIMHISCGQEPRKGGGTH
jgi:hypothetical protein